MPELREISRAFAIPGRFVDARPHGSGHINDTFIVRTEEGEALGRYVIQRINTRVFKDPLALMRNVQRVTEHLERKLAEPAGEPGRREVLRLIPTLDGAPCHLDAAGYAWRGYHFIEGTRTVDVVEGVEQAHEAGRAFGAFQRQLADLPPPRLYETIPGFHDTPARLAALERAAREDRAERSARAGPELEFVLARRARGALLTERLADGRLPERVTHNDTKLNNVLFDRTTGRSVCVIDLDTVMPGACAWDFGDLVRTATCTAEEDERDLERVVVRLDLYEALAAGYLEAARDFLEPAELESLVVGGELIALELGARFLHDFLDGDRYFKIARPDHNLDRARAQLALVASLERRRPELQGLIRGHA